MCVCVGVYVCTLAACPTRAHARANNSFPAGSIMQTRKINIKLRACVCTLSALTINRTQLGKVACGWMLCIETPPPPPCQSNVRCGAMRHIERNECVGSDILCVHKRANRCASNDVALRRANRAFRRTGQSEREGKRERESYRYSSIARASHAHMRTPHQYAE